MIQLLPIEPASYSPSRLHAENRVWVETNCYVDLWIELLNALGLECEPALAFTLSVDFEGDQWQFFKFPLEDLRTLYGLQVGEMNIWRGLEHHIEEQLTMGRLLIVDVDSWYLPDTARVSYEIEHVKTAIAPNMIDRENRRLGYFHNSGYHELEGDDFTGIFDRGHDPREKLPPYVELVKLDSLRRREDDDLFRAALAMVQSHLARRPGTNPVERFSARLGHDLGWLRAEGLATFHEYAFATLRQFGSAAELTGSLCEWLTLHGEPAAGATAEWSKLASMAKATQFQLARMVSGRSIDLEAMLEPVGRQWDTAMGMLVERYG